jgi:methionine synthase II (cobalamin-independent)
MAPAAKNTVLLPTTVVGSYSVPEWLERLKTEYYQRRISAQHLAEIHEVAIKAAVKDQELAGIDIVSDGELRRDNDVDYFLARIPGVQIPQRAKTDCFDYYETEVTRPLPELPGQPRAWPGRRPAGRLMINPDCGLRHLAPEVARQKLRAMVAGVALVRTELLRTEPRGGETS